ncbi:PAS domain S-box protein [bacterium]|nr:PAS domain S-box protein [bacterium]
MLLLILLCSSFFTVLGTAFQLYVDYRSDMNSIDDAFNQVDKSFIQPLAVSLWNFNHKQINFQINGMLSLPDMQYVEVRELKGDEEVTVAKVGILETRDIVSHTFPLEYYEGDKTVYIGSLVVTANLSNVYKRLKNKILLILTTQMVKTLFVSSIILLIFQVFIIRHLNTIAEHMERVEPDQLKPSLQLNRRRRRNKWPDALERLVDSINEMKKKLSLFIDEQYHAEHRIRELRNYLENVIDSMPSLLIGVDSLGNIIRWNKKVEVYTGISAENAKGKHFYELFPQLENEVESVKKVIDSRSICKREKIIWRTDDEIRYVNILIYPLETGQVVEAVIIIEDVTERVKMEELMIQTEKMMSVGGLAAGMAHEINNPLGGMLQGVQNISRRLTGELKPNQEAARKLGIEFDKIRAYAEERNILVYLDGIRESGERAARIISNMMRFSRPGNVEKTPVEVSRMLENTIELACNDYSLKKQYDFKNVTIIRDYDESVKPLNCIESEIEQVIFNLLKNAAQALAGMKKKEVPYVRIRTRDEGDKVRIEIIDNGTGMEPEVQRRAFEPFYTTKPVGEGTGLGLSVSYMIITNIHDGDMEINSEPGEGTSFIIHLPYRSV